MNPHNQDPPHPASPPDRTPSPSAYVPHPADTDTIGLPPELGPLAEQMARNVHETWAQSRLAEGWTYGPRRDDNLKQHPCLVPYDDLPEVEKDYDRRTSLNTLKLILKLGFRITKD